MMSKTFFSLLLIAMVGVVSSFRPVSLSAKTPKLRTVIIDPGHGGVDRGTRGLYSLEKDVNLAISLKLGKAIEEQFPDVKVVYTRTTDELPGGGDDYKKALLVRADIANKAKGDLFICIHCNATREPAGGYYAKRVIGHKKKTIYVGKGANRHKKVVNAPIYQSYWMINTRVGTESYIWKADRSGPKGDAINQADEGAEDIEDSSTSVLFDVSSPEAKIRAQLYEKMFFANSYSFASLVEDQFTKTGRESFGVKQRDKGIRVLQATGMPSVLIETGFLTNKQEEQYLNSDKGQEEVVEDIVDALRQYKDNLENGHVGPDPSGAPGQSR